MLGRLWGWRAQVGGGAGEGHRYQLQDNQRSGFKTRSSLYCGLLPQTALVFTPRLATPALIPLTLIYGGHKDGQILHILEGDGVGGRRLRICWERSRCRPKALTPPRAVRRR